MFGISVAFIWMLQGCVDHDYDLDKDIDTTVSVGGNMLTIPSSNTSTYSLSQILDLDENSSIQPNADGDFVLNVDGETSESSFEINEVVIHGLNGNRDVATVAFPVIPNDTNVPEGELNVVIGGSADTQWSRALPPFINHINLSENNLDPAIVSLSEVATDISVNFVLTFSASNYTGGLTVNRGFKIDFDKAFTVEIPASNEYCTIQDGHTLVFTANRTVDRSGLKLPVKISKIDLEGQGVDANHNFNFNAGITTTGTLSMEASGIIAGKAPSLEITTSTTIPTARIVSAVGLFNPDINIDDIQVSISDIPDFLREGDNTLDIYNPCIYLTVENQSNATVNLEAELTGYLGNMPIDGASVRIDGNNQIIVKPGVNRICVSRLGGVEGWDNVVVSNLSDIIRTMPDDIRIQCEATVAPIPVSLDLGHRYMFHIDNQIVAPLSFSSELNFTYSDEDKGWDEDLGDYNFNTVVVNIEAVSTIPLVMKPEVTPIFKEGYSCTVDVSVEGEIAGGTLAAPATSNLKIELRGVGKNLDGLDGIAYEFRASSPIVGVTLNENQGIKFSNMSFSIKGGIIVDL